VTSCNVIATNPLERSADSPKGMYMLGIKPGVVPGSDGAGEVIQIGSKVTRFQKGDRVMTLFNQGHLAGSLTPEIFKTGLGAMVDGFLREHAIYNENGLVPMPPSLSYFEASILPCAAVTAWNALYGMKPLQPGHVVLTQGTGGVSIFAVQFAKATGATVIATTSSVNKALRLKDLGADRVLNYKEEKDWGAKAKALSPNGEGVDNVIEVGGPLTLAQSLEATKMDGVISVVGFLAGVGEQSPSYMEILSRGVLVRGVLVGSRLEFEEMVGPLINNLWCSLLTAQNRAIEANKIKPVVDSKVFKLRELKE
jgi:NADPH:quinone reductase-like Zn-dependent oxidoreductase